MRVIITGAASGIGRAAARLINADTVRRTGKPARLLLADRAEKELGEAAEELRKAGVEVHTVAGDLSDPAVPVKIIQAAERALGGLDALVSNAGVIQRGRLGDLSVEEFDRMFHINTRPTWLLAKTAYPMLKASKGCVVATASVAAYEPSPMTGAYSSSKAALMMLVQQLACDWGPDGIRCNTVSPGSTRTNIGANSNVTTGQAQTPAARGNNPMGLVGEPEDPAAAIAFLVSPDARFISGADLVVDGASRTQLFTASGMGGAKAQD